MSPLVKWFLANAAALPWRPAALRDKRNPYAVWISEIMLQQTQVAAVKEHFIKWMEAFPIVQTLANASEETVLKHWQGLGYYSRAKNIHKTAKILVERYNGEFPLERDQIEALPGIGKYTAGAILSFGFHKPEAILDGNLIRVFSRLYELDFLADSTENSKAYWDYAKSFATGKDAYLQNEALMELGRSVCKIKNPECCKCPFCKTCKANINGCTEKYPPKKERQYVPWYGIMAIIQNTDGKVYTSIGDSKFLKNQRTFPHFEASPNLAEGIPQQVSELLENLGVSKVVGFQYGKDFSHSITHHKITMKPLLVTVECANPGDQWISKKQAKELPSSLCLKALSAL